MGRSCEICGRTSSVGNQITRSGSPKYKGGIGLHTGGITKRRFYPNIQSLKMVLDGKVRHVNVCMHCLKAGKVQRPPVRQTQLERSARKADERSKALAAVEAARVAALAQAEKERQDSDAEQAAREAAETAAYQARMAARGDKKGRGGIDDLPSLLDIDLTGEEKPKPKKRDDDDDRRGKKGKGRRR